MILVWRVPIKELNTERKFFSKTQTQTLATSERLKKFKNTKSNKSNNSLKGGNPNNVRLSGELLIEKFFENDKINSILENKGHQEDNTKKFIVARKMVDNV